MNIQKLKEKIKLKTLEFYDRKFYSPRMIDEIFSEFEKENKPELLKETKEFINIWKEIECMKSEIETLKKEQKAQLEVMSASKRDADRKIESLCVGEKPVEQEKQERFIFQSYDGSGKFHIYDNNQEYFHDGLFRRNQAEETCRILNEMEASK